MPLVPYPSFAETLNAIRDGSIFKDMEYSLSTMSSMVNGFPSVISSSVSTMISNVRSRIDEARSTLGRDLSLAQSNAEALAKEQLASRAPTDTTVPAFPSTVTDVVAVLKDGPNMLQAAVTNITSKVTDNALVNSAFALVNPTVQTATTAIKAFTAELASAPPQTIPDPTNPLVTIVNPEFTTFLTTGSNMAKMDALGIPRADPANPLQKLPVSGDSMGDAMKNATETISNAMDEKASAAADAVTAAVENLKTSALAMILASPHADAIAVIKNQIINPDKIDSVNMAKATIMSAAYSPAIPAANPKVGGFVSTNNVLTETDTKPSEAPSADRVQRYEIDHYYNTVIIPLMDQDKTARAQFEASPEYIQLLPLKEQATMIRNSKPEVSDRTPAEKELLINFDQARDNVKRTSTYINHSNAVRAFNEENTRYKHAVQAYATNAPRSVLDAITRSHLPLG